MGGTYPDGLSACDPRADGRHRNRRRGHTQKTYRAVSEILGGVLQPTEDGRGDRQPRQPVTTIPVLVAQERGTEPSYHPSDAGGHPLLGRAGTVCHHRHRGHRHLPGF